jgi:hypothetical protein
MTRVFVCNNRPSYICRVPASEQQRIAIKLALLCIVHTPRLGSWDTGSATDFCAYAESVYKTNSMYVFSVVLILTDEYHLFVYLFIHRCIRVPTVQLQKPVLKTFWIHASTSPSKLTLFMRITRADDRHFCWQIRLQAELVLDSSCVQTWSKPRYDFNV